MPRHPPLATKPRSTSPPTRRLTDSRHSGRERSERTRNPERSAELDSGFAPRGAPRNDSGGCVRTNRAAFGPPFLLGDPPLDERSLVILPRKRRNQYSRVLRI